MPMTVQDVLAWPPVERAGLIEVLLDSFDTAARRENDALWVKESASRLDAYHAGKLPALDFDQEFKTITAK